MAQILPRTPGIGELFGQGLGQGLGSGLNKLAEHKLNQVFQRQQQSSVAQGLTALGFGQEQASQISMLPPELQSVIVKNYLQGAESAGLDQALAGILGTGSEQVQQREDQGIQQLLQQVAPQQQQRGPELTGKDALLNAIQDYQTRQNPQQQNPTQTNSLTPTSQVPQKGNDLQDILTRPRLSPEHRLKVASLQQQRQLHNQKLSAKEQEVISKETKPYYDEVSKKAKSAKENKIRLDKLEKLIDNNEISSPLFSRTVELTSDIPAMGTFLRYLETPGDEEFKKLSNDFVKNAKDYFGSRLTDADLKVFMQTVPALTQTREGKKRVINNLNAFGEIDLLKKKAADQIIKENGGTRPRDIDAQVEDRISSQVDEIANRFKESPKIDRSIVGTIFNAIPGVGHAYRALGG